MRNPRIADVQPGVAEALLHRVLLVFPFEMRHLRCEPTEFLLTKSQNLAYIPNGGTRAVSNDVRGHGCSAGAITLEDILDHLFSVRVAREVEIDIRLLTAFFGEKALEE